MDLYRIREAIASEKARLVESIVRHTGNQFAISSIPNQQTTWKSGRAYQQVSEAVIREAIASEKARLHIVESTMRHNHSALSSAAASPEKQEVSREPEPEPEREPEEADPPVAPVSIGSVTSDQPNSRNSNEAKPSGIDHPEAESFPEVSIAISSREKLFF
jgi:hypothetical protein